MSFPIIEVQLKDKEYPRSLAQIHDPPKQLYCRGNLKLLNTFCFSVVGTRKMTPYGKEATEHIVSGLAGSGITIVSGLAMGIDAVAHQAALDSNLPTIAVLGSPVDDNGIGPRINFLLAQEILKNAKITDFNHLKNFDYLVATTSKLGTDFNLPRSPITPDKLAKSIKNKYSAKIGILFGREGQGLHNDEIKKCDFTVAIPTSKKYSAMNVSHSVGILLYELRKVIRIENIVDHINPISLAEKNQILKMFDQILNTLKFSSEEKKQTQKKVWKRIIGRSFLSKREAYAVMGFLRKIMK